MEKREIETLLEDFREQPRRAEDSELAIVEAALFVEQTFGLRLSDQEISPDQIGSPEALRRLLAARMG